MTRRARASLPLVCGSVLLSCTALMHAQHAATSAVEGVLDDPTGAAVRGAAITVTDTEQGASRTLTTDAEGRFGAPDLAPGTYLVKAAVPGFAPYAQRVELVVGRTLALTIQLEVGTASETVNVGAMRAGLDVTSSTVETVIGSAEIQNLPLNGRNYLELSFLAPGNAPAPNFDPTKSHTVLVSSAGQLGRGANVTVDGADNNDDVVGGSLGNIPEDAVEEFQMATNRYTAALGRSGSSVTNVVTREGTNQVHGAVSFFERDRHLQALPATFEPVPAQTPPFHRQQYAASLGGPVKQDKAWWFVAVEDRQQLGGLLVGTRDLATRTITRSFAEEPLHDWLSTARIDWQATPGDRFGVRESLELEDDLSGSTLDRSIGSASQQQQASNHYQSVVADWTHTFTPSLLNLFRFSDNNFLDVINPATQAPQITYPSFQDGSSFRVPQQTRQFRLQFGDTLTWNRGAHAMSFGATAERVDADFLLGVFQQGMIQTVEDFPSLDRNGDGVVDDRDLLFAVALRSAHPQQPVLIPNADNTYLAFFGQDDWHASRSLTLNLGLRYEMDTDANDRSRVNQLNPIILPFLHGTRRRLDNNWGPRVGFAWSPGGKTVVRGGYGIYYDRVVLEVESLERGLDGRALPINAYLGNVAFLQPDGTFAPGAPTFASPFSGPIIPGAGASGIDIIDNRLRNPMVQQTSLGVEREFRGDFSVRVDGVHDLGTHFIIGRPVGTVFNPVAGGPATVTNIEGSVNTHYDAMLVSVRKRFTERGELHVAYTLGKALNYSNDDQIPFTTGLIDPNNLRREYGPTPNDQRHRLVLSGIASLPWGFRLSPIWTIASGVPMDILMPDGGSRIPLLGRNAGGRQFQTGAELNAFLRQVNAAGGIDGTLLPYVDGNARFSDSFQSCDLRLSRTFRMTERMHLEAMGEVFNLFNVTNVLGTSNLNYSGFENALVRDSNDPSSAGYMRSSAFGKPVSTAGGVFGSGGPRAFQLGARLSF